MTKALAQFVYRNALWIVLPIALSLLFPSPLLAVGFVAAPALFLARWIGFGAPFPVSRVNLPILLLLSMISIGFVLSSAPGLAVVSAAQVIAGICVFFVFLDRINSFDDLCRASVGLVVLGVLFAFVAPLTVQWSANKLFGLPAFYQQVWPRLPKVTNSNILAGAIAPIVPLSLALTRQEDRRWSTLGALSLAPQILILILLQSRGALFALAIGLGVWATLYRSWILPLITLVFSVVLIANNMLGGPQVTQLLYGEVSTAGTNTFVQRQDLWVQSIYLIREFPLFGIGLGAYPQIAQTAWPNSPAHPGLLENHTHNLFLQIALDTGILGLASFIGMLVLALHSVWEASRERIEQHLAIGVLAAFAVVLVHGLGDVVVWGTAKSGIVLWLLLSLAMGLDKVRKVG